MTASELESVLRALGDTPDKVAAALRTAQVRGARRRPDCCPVATYLARVTRQPVDANPGIVDVLQAGGQPPMRVLTPRPVAEFMARFDAGVAYTDLVAEGFS